jgi:hypothetical protein
MPTPTIGTITAAHKPAAFPFSFTGTHNATGAAALLVAVTTPMSAAWDFVTATYGGANLTKLIRQTNTQGTVWLYGLNAPVSGSNTLLLAHSGQYGDLSSIVAANLSGTNTLTPFGQTVGGGGSTTLNLAITTTDVERLLVAAIAPYFHPIPTFSGATQTAVWAETTSADNAQRRRSVDAASAATYTVTATVAFNNVYGAMVEVLPVPPPPPPPAVATSHPLRGLSIPPALLAM